MSSNMKKSKVENKILEVVSYEEYTAHPELYANSGTGVEFKHDGTTYVLPHRSSLLSEDRPGVYNCGCIDKFVLPKPESAEEYTREIIDFSNVDNISELTKKIEIVRDIEREILTSPDSIFIPVISDKDSPEMRGLKEAIIAKHIDLDKYADRYGDNYPNDKRQFKKESISLSMIKRNCINLDMKAKLIIEDKNFDVPNPIGRKIEIDLTGDYCDEEE